MQPSSQIAFQQKLRPTISFGQLFLVRDATKFWISGRQCCGQQPPPPIARWRRRRWHPRPIASPPRRGKMDGPPGPQAPEDREDLIGTAARPPPPDDVQKVSAVVHQSTQKSIGRRSLSTTVSSPSPQWRSSRIQWTTEVGRERRRRTVDIHVQWTPGGEQLRDCDEEFTPLAVAGEEEVVKGRRRRPDDGR